MPLESRELLRHLLATIAYRLAKSIHQVDEAFYNLESTNGIRKPMEIMRHMCQILNYTLSVLTNHSPSQLPPLDGPAEVNRFYNLLNQVDQRLTTTDLEPTLILKLIQGPLADLLTHIGQIALLRRVFNDPVAGENFMIARITAGVLNQEDQILPN